MHNFGMFMVAVLLFAGSLVVLVLMNKVWFYKTFLRRHPALSRAQAAEIRKLGGDPLKDWGQKNEPMKAGPVDMGKKAEQQGTTHDSHDLTQRPN